MSAQFAPSFVGTSFAPVGQVLPDVEEQLVGFWDDRYEPEDCLPADTTKWWTLPVLVVSICLWAAFIGFLIS